MIKETEIKTNERTNKQTDKQLDKKKKPTQMTQTQTGIYIQMRIDMHAKKMSKQCLNQKKFILNVYKLFLYTICSIA